MEGSIISELSLCPGPGSISIPNLVMSESKVPSKISTRNSPKVPSKFQSQIRNPMCNPFTWA